MLCYYFQAFDQNMMVLVYPSIFLVHFTMLAPTSLSLVPSKISSLENQNARLSSNVFQCATLNVIMQIFFHLKKLLMLTNIIILAISKHDTLKPLGIQFRRFADSVYVTLNTINGVIGMIHNITQHSTLILWILIIYQSMLKKMHMKAQIYVELPISNCYVS